jgi:signal transduction histidine kinase
METYFCAGPTLAELLRQGLCEEGHSVTIAKDGQEGCVKDSGIGIQPDAIPHIFERFYRVDASHNRNGGAGLGLAIAQSIAAAHGSSIQVESSPGIGSCFSILLKK